MAKESDRGATASQLRDAIDRGKAGDKVPVADPAAAPLGTDDEAAGVPVASARAREALHQEVGGAPTHSGIDEDANSAAGNRASNWQLLMVVAIVLAVAAVAWVLT
jgi:hypothetical protein